MEFPFGHHHRRNEEDDYPPPPPSFPHHHGHHHQNDFPPPPQPDQPFNPDHAGIQHHYHQNPSQQEPNYGYPPPPQPDHRDQQPFNPDHAEIQHHYHQNPSQQEPNYGYPPPPQPDHRDQQPFKPDHAEIQHHYHQIPSQQEPDYGYPPPQQPDHGYPPPPQQSGYSSTTVHHSSHEVNYPRSEPEFPHGNIDHSYNRHDRPENQTIIHHHSHESGESELLNKPTVRVYCKAEPNYSLSIRDGKVILARSDPCDLSQHWIKDEKYSVRVKDEEGCPSFALINKATGQAMKHSVGATHPVQLRHYNQNELDESVLWAESKDTGEGYRCIRMINNIRLNLDAFHGDKYSGGVHDGTILVLWEWLNGENQRWKIVHY